MSATPTSRMPVEDSVGDTNSTEHDLRKTNFLEKPTAARLMDAGPTRGATPPPAQPEVPVGGPAALLPSASAMNWDAVVQMLVGFSHRVRSTPPLTLAWVVLLIAALMGGNAMQVIFLNYWLRQYPPDGAPGNYTTFAVSGLMFSLFFLVALALYVLVCRPNLRFALQRGSWRLLVGIASMDTLNSALAIYAASHTPAVLQVLFTALVPVYAALFTKWLLCDPRKYMNPWVLSSFAFIISGVGIAAVYNFTHHAEVSPADGDRPADSARDRRLWAFIFCISVPPTVLLNVWQTVYMMLFTEEPATLSSNAASSEALVDDTPLMPRDRDDPFMYAASPAVTVAAAAERHGRADEDHHDLRGRVAASTEADASSGTASFAADFAKGDDTAVKLVMLAGGTTLQALMIFALLPMDALPWYGGSPSVSAAWENLKQGVVCVLRCPHNLRFCCLYSLGFVVVYIAAAYLNQYSVTLCSMVSQMSAPLTALILIVFPQWNPSGNAAPWYISALSVILLSAGTSVYVVWDEQTGALKQEGERRLKQQLMSGGSRGNTSGDAGYVVVTQEEQ